MATAAATFTHFHDESLAGVQAGETVTAGSVTCTRGGRPPLLPTPDLEPLPDWADAWTGYELELQSIGRARNTIRNRRFAVQAMARHATAEGIRPQDVTKPWLQRYLIAQRKDRRGNGYTVLYEDLRQFWGWYAAEYGTKSPLEGTPRPKTVETDVKVYTREELGAILAACSGTTWLALRDRAILLVLIDSGVRRAELSQLDIGDLDLKGRTITVRHGKGDKPRVTVMGDAAATALWRYLKSRGTPETGPVFAGRCGERLTPSGIGQALASLGRRAGVDGVRPHRFRHSWAHYLKADGVQDGDLMQLGGWTSVRVMMRYGRSNARERALDAGRAHQVSATLPKVRRSA